MKPGVVRQLIPEEIELIARNNGLDIPQDGKQFYVLGFVYTDPDTAKAYIHANRARHGHTVHPVTDSKGNAASITVIEAQKAEDT
jgi:hypothetical protein